MILFPHSTLQSSIVIENGNYVRALIFPSPQIINKTTKLEFIVFTNACNRYVLTGKGRFWIDIDKHDFVYEILLPVDEVVDNKKEAGYQLFDLPIAHFNDLITPLYMLRMRKWKASLAIQYIDELRTNGFVNNDDYDLT